MILSIHTCSLIESRPRDTTSLTLSGWPCKTMCTRKRRESCRFNNDITCQVPEGPSNSEADAKKTKPRDAKESHGDKK